MAPQRTIELSMTVNILACLERIIMVLDLFRLHGTTIMNQQEKI